MPRRAAASALAEGYRPAAIGEAISLAASLLVLRDGGRLPQYEDEIETAGCVHGDSMGVHASDAANAWRNLARVSSGHNVFACLMIGAWQVARDRNQPGNLLASPLPVKYHLDRLTATDADGCWLNWTKRFRIICRHMRPRSHSVMVSCHFRPTVCSRQC